MIFKGCGDSLHLVDHAAYHHSLWRQVPWAAVIPYTSWTMMHITTAHANMLSGPMVNPYAL